MIIPCGCYLGGSKGSGCMDANPDNLESHDYVCVVLMHGLFCVWSCCIPFSVSRQNICTNISAWFVHPI